MGRWQPCGRCHVPVREAPRSRMGSRTGAGSLRSDLSHGIRKELPGPMKVRGLRGKQWLFSW